MNDTPDCMSVLIAILLASNGRYLGGDGLGDNLSFDFVDIFAALLIIYNGGGRLS
jgi:hypothetical protein